MAGFDSPEPTLIACTPGNRLSVCISEPLKFSSMNCLFALTTLRADFICTSLLELPLTTTSFRDTPSLIMRFMLSALAEILAESSGKEMFSPAVPRLLAMAVALDAST